jgi:hypothetical protein
MHGNMNIKSIHFSSSQFTSLWSLVPSVFYLFLCLGRLLRNTSANVYSFPYITPQLPGHRSILDELMQQSQLTYINYHVVRVIPKRKYFLQHFLILVFHVTLCYFLFLLFYVALPVQLFMLKWTIRHFYVLFVSSLTAVYFSIQGCYWFIFRTPDWHSQNLILVFSPSMFFQAKQCQ